MAIADTSVRTPRPLALLQSILIVWGVLVIAACDPPRVTDSPSVAMQVTADAAANLAPKPLKPPVSGDVVVVGGIGALNKSTAIAEYYNPATGKFSATGAALKPAALAIGGLLTAGVPNTELLIGGGFTGVGKFFKRTVGLNITGAAIDDLEIYDTSTGKFHAANAPLLEVRFGATATVLQNGKVLIAGGADSSGNPTATAEVFDPTTGTTTATANNMSSPRLFHTATLIQSDGTVLLAGGGVDNNGDLTDTADIYDPAANQFTPTFGAMLAPVAAHAALYLPATGQVLIAGGANSFGALFATTAVETYDPATHTFSIAPNSMNDARAFHTMTQLLNGQVVVIGGFSFGDASIFQGKPTGLFGISVDTAEIYDPTAQTFTCVGGTGKARYTTCNPTMPIGRGGHTATLFTSGPKQGQVLVAGGFGAPRPAATSAVLRNVELFNPATNKFSPTGPMRSPHGLHQAFLLP